MELADTPRFDQFEISVFGPGRGESIVVHLGYNEWCVIDSCLGPGRSESAATEYLSLLGGGALEGVLLVLATHWHDDHIRGIASSLRAFPNAQFSCSAALHSEQFIKLVKLEGAAVQRNSGVDEFGMILDILLERRKIEMPKSLVAPRLAVEGRPLLLRNGPSRTFPASVTALSPSDGTIKLGLDNIAKLVPRPGQPQLRITNEAPNKTSVAVWIEVGTRRALLGADLEHSGKAGEGWVAVLESFQPAERADLIKVPHHGSPNADCPEVWQKLLTPLPFAVLTPFTSGVGLPQAADLIRLKARTQNLYSTASLKARLPKRENMVERKLRDRERVAVEGKLGHVRIRWSATDPSETPEVDLFSGAFKVDVDVQHAKLNV